MGVRPLLAAAAALFLSACEVYAVPSPIDCPGQQQGVFNFGGSLTSDPTACSFAQPGNPSALQVNNPIGFSGTINFATVPDPGAAICISAAHAVPRIGTYAVVDSSTQSLRVSYGRPPASPAVAGEVKVFVGGCGCPSLDAVAAAGCSCPANTPLTGCSCPVFIQEAIQGLLTLPRPGATKSFTGTQVVSVFPPIGLAANLACDCQSACKYTYDMTATEVGSR